MKQKQARHHASPQKDPLPPAIMSPYLKRATKRNYSYVKNSHSLAIALMKRSANSLMDTTSSAKTTQLIQNIRRNSA